RSSRKWRVLAGAFAALVGTFAYAGSGRWIEPTPARLANSHGKGSAADEYRPEPVTPASGAAEVTPGASQAPLLGPRAEPERPASNQRPSHPPAVSRATPTPSWNEVSDALSAGDHARAKTLLLDLSSRSDDANTQAKAQLGLAQLEAAHGNCERAKILALGVAGTSGIETKTVRRALELAMRCTD
ncbi:MAG TPA: hypothetical protein VF881_13750, partial [Polyangiaceae bacterium]